MEATKRKNQVAKKEDHKKNQSGTEPKTVTVHVLFVQQTVGGAGKKTEGSRRRPLYSSEGQGENRGTDWQNHKKCAG